MQLELDENLAFAEGFIALLTRAAELTLERERVAHEGLEVSLSFVPPDEMAVLNERYRGGEGPTDVLSFPMYGSVDELREAAAARAGAPVLLGDVVICGEMAERQAEEYGHSSEHELLYLFVHSMFHLLGYDHENEGGRSAMRAAEREVLGALNSASSGAEIGGGGA